MKAARCNSSDEASPATLDNIPFNRLLLLACKLNSISPIVVDAFIPRKQGLRNTFAFKCLVHIKISPGLTKAGYARSFNTCQQATCHVIDYLVQLGLIMQVGKPRLIIPFQAYKIDKAYKLTSKGNKVINKVFNLEEMAV